MDRERKHKSKKSRERREKKQKEKKRARHSSSDSDSDESPAEELARVRRAVTGLRTLLGSFPASKRDLRQLLWNLDADDEMRRLLTELFQSLRLRELQPTVWMSRPGAALSPELVIASLTESEESLRTGSSSLRLIGHVFDERIAAIPAPAAAPVAEMQEPQEPSTVAALPLGAALEQEDKEDADEDYVEPPPGAAINGGEEPDAGGIGAAGPPLDALLRPSMTLDAGPAAVVHTAVESRARRVLGPIAPPAEVLAAAAELAHVLVGPPPPEAVEQDAAETAETRDGAVASVIKRMATQADAYAMLGVAPKAVASEVKKAFWRLSLLVHPDKCDHPQAQDAFQALAAARDVLSDASKRAALDEQRDEAAWREERQAEQAFARQQAEWRKLRGESLPGDAELLSGSAGKAADMPATREAWMTELPPERQIREGEIVLPTSTTAFSRNGRAVRGDTSAWTDTPLLAAERQQQLLLERAMGQVPEAVAAAIAGREKTAATAAMVDQFNGASRPKSLLEQHKEKLQGGSGSKKRKGTAAPGSAVQPYPSDDARYLRPFDRDRDLTAPRKPVDPNAGGGSLSARFGGAGGGGSRSFL